MMNRYQKSADERFLFRPVDQTNFWMSVDRRYLWERKFNGCHGEGSGEIWY